MKTFTLELSRTKEGAARGVMRDDKGAAVAIYENRTSEGLGRLIYCEVIDQFRGMESENG